MGVNHFPTHPRPLRAGFAMMPHYPVRCHARGCPHPAVFKLGAVWADGTTRELKTYSLCCSTCLPAELASARLRRGRCRLAPGEDLGPVCVFELRTGARDRELVRREELESPGEPAV